MEGLVIFSFLESRQFCALISATVLTSYCSYMFKKHFNYIRCWFIYFLKHSNFQTLSRYTPLFQLNFHFHFRGPTSRVRCCSPDFHQHSFTRSHFLTSSHITQSHITTSHPPLQSTEHSLCRHSRRQLDEFHSHKQPLGSNSTLHQPRDRNCRRSRNSLRALLQDFIDTTCEQ